MSEALFTPDSGDSAETQYEEFRARCYKATALMLKPRAEALTHIVEREVRRTLDDCLENDERMSIDIRHTPAGLDVTATTA